MTVEKSFDIPKNDEFENLDLDIDAVFEILKVLENLVSNLLVKRERGRKDGEQFVLRNMENPSEEINFVTDSLDDVPLQALKDEFINRPEKNKRVSQEIEMSLIVRNGICFCSKEAANNCNVVCVRKSLYKKGNCPPSLISYKLRN